MRLLLFIILLIPITVYSQKHYSIVELQERLNVPYDLGFDKVSDSHDLPYAYSIVYSKDLNNLHEEIMIGHSLDTANKAKTVLIGYRSPKRGELKKWKKEIKLNNDFRLIYRAPGVFRYWNEGDKLLCDFYHYKINGVMFDGICLYPKYYILK
jgi:hypothetical protein